MSAVLFGSKCFFAKCMSNVKCLFDVITFFFGGGGILVFKGCRFALEIKIAVY